MSKLSAVLLGDAMIPSEGFKGGLGEISVPIWRCRFCGRLGDLLGQTSVSPAGGGEKGAGNGTLRSPDPQIWKECIRFDGAFYRRIVQRDGCHALPPHR